MLRSLPIRNRSGFTLLELTVVVAVLGAIAVAATSMLGARRVTASLEARQQAELLAGSLRVARLQSIASLQPVTLSFDFAGRNLVGYTLANPELVQSSHTLPSTLQASASARSIIFMPNGTTNQSLTTTFSGESGNTWQVDVFSGSGQVLVQQVP